jgi:large repetitive protein
MARERAEKAERAAVRRLPGGRSRRFELALAAAGAIAAIVVAGGSAADFDIDNGPCRETPGEALLLRCPTAYVGVPYEVQIESEEGSGCTSPGNPYIWYEIVNSSLPGGLSMSRAGLISGIPTGAGFTRFWIWNHDLTASEGGPPWCDFEDRSEHEFSIAVDPGLAIVNQSVKPASIGEPYSETLTAKRADSLSPVTGPDVHASWSVQSGSLPPGITLSTSGALAGTPTTEGSYQFVVKAQNGGPFDTETYTLAVRQPVTVRSPFASARPPRSEVGIRFGATAAASGGTGRYTWTLVSGALPAGLALNSASGAVAGTPQSAGNFAFALTATDDEGRVATANGALTVAPRLAIRTVRLKTARLGRAYRARLATGGGVRPVTWKVSGKLPPGVRFAKALGALTGTPSRAGTFRLTVQAVDALGAKAQTKLVLDVRQ